MSENQEATNSLIRKNQKKDKIDYINSLLLNQEYNFSKPIFLEKDSKTYDQKIKDAEVRNAETKAEDAAADVKLKKRISNFIIVILVFQTVVVFTMTYFQGIKTVPFYNYQFALEEWNFRILVTSTLLQTYLLMKIVVLYLFPQRTSVIK